MKYFSPEGQNFYTDANFGGRNDIEYSIYYIKYITLKDRMPMVLGLLRGGKSPIWWTFFITARLSQIHLLI